MPGDLLQITCTTSVDPFFAAVTGNRIDREFERAFFALIVDQAMPCTKWAFTEGSPEMVLWMQTHSPNETDEVVRAMRNIAEANARVDARVVIDFVDTPVDHDGAVFDVADDVEPPTFAFGWCGAATAAKGDWQSWDDDVFSFFVQDAEEVQ